MNGQAVKKFWEDFTFWKFIISLLVVTITNVSLISIQISKVNDHIENDTSHLDYSEKSLVDNIQEYGFTYSYAEKLKNEVRVSKLEEDVKQIKKEIDKLYSEGRAQTPAQKKKLIEEVIETYLNRRAK